VPGVLFVGAGREQRPAIVRARERGYRVVAVDEDARAEGLGHADVAEVADLDNGSALAELARRHGVDGVLTIGLDQVATAVADAAERVGLPSIGPATAHRFSHVLALRRTLAEEGVPQPAYAAVRNLAEGRAAIDVVGLPAVLKPADADRQRGLFRIDEPGDLESHLHASLAESHTHEAVLESYVDGVEMNAVVVARGGTPRLVCLSDRPRPPGEGFGVAWALIHPAAIHSDQLAAAERLAERTVSVLGLRDGIALVQLVATPERALSVLGASAGVPGGRLAELVRQAVGVDLLDLALLFALGEEVPDEAMLPRAGQPMAIRFLTGAPGSLPTGRVVRVGALGPVLSADGVLDAEVLLAAGDVVGPFRRADDRHGYVLATGPTTVEALANADDAASLLVVEVE
jgi:biotin carboxylase